MTNDSHSSDGPRANDREPIITDTNSPVNIGYVRIRDILHNTGSSTSGEYNEDTVEFDISAFDMKLFTEITYSAHSGTAHW